jgi:hypothetical protein
MQTRQKIIYWGRIVLSTTIPLTD